MKALPWESRHEEALSRALGGVSTVAWSHGRLALRALLEGLALKPGDEVVLPALTCKVVPLTLMSLELVPRYVDVDPTTLNLDPSALESAFGERTRAVIFQHTFGIDIGLDETAEIARRKGVILIEDRAQCLPWIGPGSSLRGVAAIFSNNFMKPLSAGSGGVVATSDHDLLAKIRALRDASPRPSAARALRVLASRTTFRCLYRPRRYWRLADAARRVQRGYRADPVPTQIRTLVENLCPRITRAQARAGNRSLMRIESEVERRSLRVLQMARALVGHPGISVRGRALSGPLAYFPLEVTKRNEFLARARQHRLPVVAWPGDSVLYPVSQPAELVALGYEPGSCPKAEAVAARLVGLSLEPGLTADQERALVDLVR